MSDSAKIALNLWENRGDNLLEYVKKSEHAIYLEHIGYKKDLAFACELDVSTVVPMLAADKEAHTILRSVSGNARPYHKETESVKPEMKPAKRADPFEELLTYTKKPSEYFYVRKKEK